VIEKGIKLILGKPRLCQFHYYHRLFTPFPGHLVSVIPHQFYPNPHNSHKYENHQFHLTQHYRVQGKHNCEERESLAVSIFEPRLAIELSICIYANG
jgi:hypothetical protein